MAGDDALERAVGERERDRVALHDAGVRHPRTGDRDHPRALVERRDRATQVAAEERGAASHVEGARRRQRRDDADQLAHLVVPARPVAVGEPAGAEPPVVVLRGPRVVVAAHRVVDDHGAQPRSPRAARRPERSAPSIVPVHPPAVCSPARTRCGEPVSRAGPRHPCAGRSRPAPRRCGRRPPDRARAPGAARRRARIHAGRVADRLDDGARARPRARGVARGRRPRPPAAGHRHHRARRRRLAERRRRASRRCRRGSRRAPRRPAAAGRRRSRRRPSRARRRRTRRPRPRSRSVSDADAGGVPPCPRHPDRADRRAQHDGRGRAAASASASRWLPPATLRVSARASSAGSSANQRPRRPSTGYADALCSRAAKSSRTSGSATCRRERGRRGLVRAPRRPRPARPRAPPAARRRRSPGRARARGPG